VVRWFDLNAGIGMIVRDGTGDDVFFHFTALPGQGYRTIHAGSPVKFELVESSNGLTARNIQAKSVP
jgi:cold shock CspA family protein